MSSVGGWHEPLLFTWAKDVINDSSKLPIPGWLTHSKNEFFK